MKSILILLLWNVLSLASATPTIQVFISFSLPEQLLKQTLVESSKLHIPAILNGLYHNSMTETAKKVLALTKEVPDLNLQIDPVSFERFGIKQVPALVVSNAQGFDVIYGNLTVREGLYRIADSANESGITRTDLRKMLNE